MDPVQPLAGVTVLELSQILAGPTCGVMLADLGADVIKVEKFPGGDDARGYRRDGDGGLAPSFLMVNRGKRSLAVDIRAPRGRDLVQRLAQRADVLTENFRLGTLDRLGLGYDTLSALNPQLVYCSITGYGRHGPLAHQGGFDLILQAYAGLLSVTGEPGGRPVKPGNSVADINAGILAAFGVLAGYIERLRTGRGTRVDTSLLHASLQQMVWFAAAYFSQGIVARPSGTAHPLTAPYEAFEAADGALVIGGANQANWERIAQVLGAPEWRDDPRFATSAARLANRAALAAAMNERLAREPVAHWLARFDAAGVPAGPVHDVGQAMEHPQSRAAGMVIDVRHPDGHLVRGLGSPVQLGGRAHADTRPAPRLGQHTTEVLRGFGLSDDDVQALIAEGVVHQAEVPA